MKKIKRIITLLSAAFLFTSGLINSNVDQAQAVNATSPQDSLNLSQFTEAISSKADFESLLANGGSGYLADDVTVKWESYKRYYLNEKELNLNLNGHILSFENVSFEFDSSTINFYDKTESGDINTGAMIRIFNAETVNYDHQFILDFSNLNFYGGRYFTQNYSTDTSHQSVDFIAEHNATGVSNVHFYDGQFSGYDEIVVLNSVCTGFYPVNFFFLGGEFSNLETDVIIPSFIKDGNTNFTITLGGKTTLSIDIEYDGSLDDIIFVDSSFDDESVVNISTPFYQTLFIADEDQLGGFRLTDKGYLTYDSESRKASSTELFISTQPTISNGYTVSSTCDDVVYNWEKLTRTFGPVIHNPEYDKCNQIDTYDFSAVQDGDLYKIEFFLSRENFPENDLFSLYFETGDDFSLGTFDYFEDPTTSAYMSGDYTYTLTFYEDLADEIDTYYFLLFSAQPFTIHNFQYRYVSSAPLDEEYVHLSSLNYLKYHNDYAYRCKVSSYFNEKEYKYSNTIFIDNYSLTYSLNGGTLPAGFNVNNPSEAYLPTTLPVPTKDGFVFEGWYTDSNFDTKAVAGSFLACDTTLYAKWGLGHSHGGLTFAKPISDSNDLLELFQNGGTGYLANDITVPNEDCLNYQNSNVTLCLNGHNIRIYSLILSNCNFSIYDCDEGGMTCTAAGDYEALFNLKDGSVLNMYGGKYFYDGLNACSVCVYGDGGTFNMYGGSIKSFGIGVFHNVNQTEPNYFNLFGGSIDESSQVDVDLEFEGEGTYPTTVFGGDFVCDVVYLYGEKDFDFSDYMSLATGTNAPRAGMFLNFRIEDIEGKIFNNVTEEQLDFIHSYHNDLSLSLESGSLYIKRLRVETQPTESNNFTVTPNMNTNNVDYQWGTASLNVKDIPANFGVTPYSCGSFDLNGISSSSEMFVTNSIVLLFNDERITKDTKLYFDCTSDITAYNPYGKVENLGNNKYSYTFTNPYYLVMFIMGDDPFTITNFKYENVDFVPINDDSFRTNKLPSSGLVSGTYACKITDRKNSESWVLSDIVDLCSHVYGTPTYTWKGDYCIANATCELDTTHTVDEIVERTYVKDTDATCTEAEKGHYVATFTNTLFSEQSTAANSVTGPNAATGHDYNTPTYTWKDDTCTAKRTCKNCEHFEQEDAFLMFVSDTDATCTEAEKGHFDALFSNSAFVTQSGAANSVTNPNPPLGHIYNTPTYTWNGNTCTAKRTCKNCEYFEQESGTVEYIKDNNPTCTEAEKGHYVATFTNTAFVTQTGSTNSVTGPNAATGHDYNTPIYTWNGNTCTAKRTCKNCEHFEQESGVVTYVKDADPTCTVAEKGHYVATFTNGSFTTQTGTANSVTGPNAAKGHNYNNPTYTWDGDTCLAKRTCKDCEYFEQESGVVTYVKDTDATCTVAEKGHYTATFTNASFATQTKENVEKGTALGHNYSSQVTKPTCTEQGYTTHTCTRCSDSYKDTYTNATGHTAATDNAVLPTCTTTGLTEGSRCSVCNEVLVAQTEVAASGHDLQHHDAQAATCTAIGWDAYDTCSKCSYTTYNEIAALGHNYSSQVTKPTCTEQGYTTHTCTKCSDSYKDTYTNATGHTAATDNAVLPTCTTTGLTKGSHCSVCNEVLVAQTEFAASGHDLQHHDAQAPTCTAIGWDAYDTCSKCSYTTYNEIAALGHNYSSQVTKPTCTEQGYTTHTCTRCSDSYKDTYINATGHTAATDNAVLPTCTATGLTEGSHCSVCNEVLVTQTEVAATGHNLQHHDAQAPTCTAIGWDAYDTCSKCSYTTYNEIAALGHNYSSQVTKPTCTGQGYTTHTCSRCSDSYKDTYTNATGHTAATDNAVLPTCTATGLTEGSHCSVCNEVLVAQTEVAASGHNLQHHDAQAATCTAIGWDAYDTCSKCSYTTYNEIAALGHNYSSQVTNPTCTEQGYTTHTCSRCSDSYKDTYTNATGHTAATDNAVLPTCTATGLTEGSHCSVCNEVLVAQTEVAASGHNWSEYVSNNDATLSADGTKTRECNACHNQETVADVGSKKVESIVNNTETSSNSESTVNVKVETEKGFDPNMTIEVKIEVVKGEQLEGTNLSIDYSTQTKKNETLTGVYDIKLLLDGQQIDVSTLGQGTVLTIRILLPEGIDPTNFRLIHVHDSSDITEIVLGDKAGVGTYVIEDGYLVTQIDRLSEFAFFKVDSGLSAGAIIAIILLSILLLVAIVYFAGYFFCYRKGHLDNSSLRVIYKWLPRGNKEVKSI